MIPSLVPLPAAAPLVRVRRPMQKSHMPAYRKMYLARVKARESEFGVLNRKRKGDMMAGLSIRSATEVAKILGITKEAVRQIENRAISKLRRALHHLYVELGQH